MLVSEPSCRRFRHKAYDFLHLMETEFRVQGDRPTEKRLSKIIGDVALSAHDAAQRYGVPAVPTPMPRLLKTATRGESQRFVVLLHDDLAFPSFFVEAHQRAASAVDVLRPRTGKLNWSL